MPPVAMSAVAFIAVLTAVYWGGFALIGGVSLTAQWGLYLGCLATWRWIHPRMVDAGAPSAGWWLMSALQSSTCAVLFYGANQAKDILDGVHRAKAPTPEWLGGLELWWLLAPGVASIALASAAVRWLVARRTTDPGTGRP